MPYIHNFSLKLKVLRMLHGLHQQDLAERIGVQRYAIVEIEKGRAMPSPEQLAAIEEALGIKFDEHTERAFAVLAPNLAREREVATNGC